MGPVTGKTRADQYSVAVDIDNLFHCSMTGAWRGSVQAPRACRSQFGCPPERPVEQNLSKIIVVGCVSVSAERIRRDLPVESEGT